MTEAEAEAMAERVPVTQEDREIKLLSFVLRCAAENPASIGLAQRKAVELLESLGIEPRDPPCFFHTEEADLNDARHRIAAEAILVQVQTCAGEKK